MSFHNVIGMRRSSSLFLIESESSRHRLFLNGQEIATFASLDGAEAEANKIANSAARGIALQFQLDFKWTLSDLEIRVATLPEQEQNAAQDSAAGRACASTHPK